MGPTAADALARLWPSRGVDVTVPMTLDRRALFGRVAPLVLEIGSGMGEATIAMASADPLRDFLAVDVHTPGLGALLARSEALGLANVAAARGDAVELLEHGLEPAALDEICVFFPDPWPKARHHKRRIVRPAIVALMRDRLRPGGTLRTATDWPHYAEQMIGVLGADPGLRNAFDGYAPGPGPRPPTRFEERGRSAGRPIHDCVFVRVDTG
ncbi:MAG TPA: tRNA (guanosine(46)-N7)-methyltransferase TrmB [Micromonosporaceae bacterium]|nr:tRNA (guanosine(46)-N7)-methyltransferase TrmB [Micromonosporaceae bacterium]